MTERKPERISRRTLLKYSAAAALTLIPSTLSGQAAAAEPAKASKEAMKYQDKPKGDQRCDNCVHWIPGKTPKAKGQCKIVVGDIDPQGWCIAWAPMPKST